MTFDWIIPLSGDLWRGFLVTVQLTVLSGIFGFFGAVCVAFGRMSKNFVIAKACLGFTTLIRGTPLLVQIYLLYYGVGSLFRDFPAIRESFLWQYLRDGFWYVVLALVISVSAYVGEVIRGGLRAVPKGEVEAARAFGMSGLTLVRRIWLPRALQILMPSLSGECVMLLKSTALASTVAVMDMLGVTNAFSVQSLKTYEPMLLITVIYLILAMFIEHVFRRIEARLPTRSAI